MLGAAGGVWWLPDSPPCVEHVACHFPASSGKVGRASEHDPHVYMCVARFLGPPTHPWWASRAAAARLWQSRHFPASCGKVGRASPHVAYYLLVRFYRYSLYDMSLGCCIVYKAILGHIVVSCCVYDPKIYHGLPCSRISDCIFLNLLILVYEAIVLP